MQNPAKRHLQKPPAANKFALTEKRHSGKFRSAVFLSASAGLATGNVCFVSRSSDQSQCITQSGDDIINMLQPDGTGGAIPAEALASRCASSLSWEWVVLAG